MIELLAPAGDLEKLKIAIIYGADAVFVGGKKFSLRANASNFELSDLKEAADFVHAHGKKLYVTTNVIPHHDDMNGLLEYLQSLDEIGIDAIITASPYIIDTALKHTNLEVHISTQQSAMNVQTVNFWKNKGASRVVLARDLTLEEIKDVTTNTDTEIEVFIHGGMCAGYSGRCSLSNHLTNKDANRGGCAHTCRWFFDLKENEENITETPFTLASKDLSAVYQIPSLIDMGVASLKIEGRMKSIHYIATVVQTYRLLIDEYIKNKEVKDYTIYEEMLKNAENRETSYGFFNGLPTKDQQLFEKKQEIVMQNFVGLVMDYCEETKMATIQTRNVFKKDELLEVFSFDGDSFKFNNEVMLDDNNEPLDRAFRAKSLVKVHIPKSVKPFSMLRVIR